MRTGFRYLLALMLALGLLAAPGLADEHEEPAEETESGDDEEVEPEPEPIDMTLYLKGDEQVGETELTETWLDSAYRPMDEDEPAGGDAKSFQAINYVAGPNTACSGNGLMPTWQAWFEGTLLDDLTVTLHTLAAPGTDLHVNLYADVPDNACNEDYIDPVASTTVSLEPGQAETEATFEGLEVEVRDRLVLMAYTTDTGQARLFYDSEDMPSRVELTCLPLFVDAETCLW